MAETMKFLDFTGLSLYDSKIKSYIADQIGGAGKLTYSVVTELPPVSSADPYTIYLVSRSAGQKTSDIYDEYLLINGAFELIGNTEVDFSNYYTKAQVDGFVSGLKGASTDAATAETIYGAKAYADAAVANKNVSATGETGTSALVSASAANNSVTVSSTQKLQDAVSRAESAVLSVTKGVGGVENKVTLNVTDGDNVTITLNDSALKTWIDKIDGDNTTAGSIAKALKDAKDYADSKITGLTETSKTSTNGTYVTVTVVTEEGQVKSVSVSDTIVALANATASNKGLAEAKDVKDYVDSAVSGKNVDAEGESGTGALVTASASNNKVTVATTQKLKDAVSAAESAVQSVTTGSANGTISVDGSNVSVYGLDTAAYTTVTALNSTAQGYANAVLGTNADTSASVTVYGARAYADSLVASLNPVDSITTAEINSLFPSA